MILNNLLELRIVGVFDRGMPNLERIAISVQAAVNMGQFGVLLGVRQQQGVAVPIRDNFFWFGDGMVGVGDWVFLYTGTGEPRCSDLPNTTQKLYTLHWDRPATILHNQEIVPILIRVDAVDVAVEPVMLATSAGQKSLGR